jgi:hypothetical protein
MITTPKLPPKPGYVEVEIGGIRKYKNAATGILLEKEEAAPSKLEQLQAQMDTLTLDMAEQIVNLQAQVDMLSLGE